MRNDSNHAARGLTRSVLSLVGAMVIAVAMVQPVAAATFAVDDSTSYTHDANTAMKWKLVAPSRRLGSLVEGATLVTVRLNLMPWANKSGKIYMALGKQAIGPVKATWTTQGRLLAGQLNSGDRTLVYAGPIRTAILEDTIALTIETDGQRLVSAQRLQFYFEIDLD
jgi:hypothetical protein